MKEWCQFLESSLIIISIISHMPVICQGDDRLVTRSLLRMLLRLEDEFDVLHHLYVTITTIIYLLINEVDYHFRHYIVNEYEQLIISYILVNSER